MNELLNAMIELVVLWSKVVFAAPLRVTYLPPTIGRIVDGAGRGARSEAGLMLFGQLGASAPHPLPRLPERDASDADVSRFLPQSRPHRRSEGLRGYPDPWG